jgi:hypothetical protein
MANKEAQKQGFVYGLQAVRFKGQLLGYIKKGSFDFGGTKGEAVDIEAEQVPDAPVWTLLQSNGTIKPKFSLIQLKYENLQQMMGGELVKNDQDEVIGWAAPVDLTQVNGPFQIDTPSGHRIDIFSAMMNATFAGGLTMDAVAEIECELSVLKPADGTSPYRIVDIPEEDLEDVQPEPGNEG